MNRAFYSSSITNFIAASDEEIIGKISLGSEFSDQKLQKDAWVEEIKILKDVLVNYIGQIYFEYSIPRIGQRIDVLLIIKSVIFVLEFKVGEKKYTSNAIDQVTDYALDLKNFHETSHDKFIAPILIATNAKGSLSLLELNAQEDKLFQPVKTNPSLLNETINNLLQLTNLEEIDIAIWEMEDISPLLQ